MASLTTYPRWSRVIALISRCARNDHDVFGIFPPKVPFSLRNHPPLSVELPLLWVGTLNGRTSSTPVPTLILYIYPVRIFDGNLLYTPTSISLLNKRIFAMSKGVSLVTGSGQGIGRAIALRLADDQYDVAINDISPNKANLEILKAEIEAKGRRALIVIADVSQEEQVQGMVDSVVKTLGGLDVVRYIIPL
jgi:hypothetical protein